MYNKAESAPSCNRNLILENKLSNRHVCSLSFSQLHGNFSTITDYSVPRTCNHGMQMEFLTKFPVHFGYAGSRWKLPLTKGSVCLFSSVLGWSKGIPSTLWCLFFPIFPQAPNSHSTKGKTQAIFPQSSEAANHSNGEVAIQSSKQVLQEDDDDNEVKQAVLYVSMQGRPARTYLEKGKEEVSGKLCSKLLRTFFLWAVSRGEGWDWRGEESRLILSSTERSWGTSV